MVAIPIMGKSYEWWFDNYSFQFHRTYIHAIKLGLGSFWSAGSEIYIELIGGSAHMY